MTSLASLITPPSKLSKQIAALRVDPDEATLDEIKDDLNLEFVIAFSKTGLEQDAIREFVYALDHLDELTRTPNFPTDRLLTSSDVINFGEHAIHVLGNRRLHYTAGVSGVAVNDHQLEMIDSFYDHRYLVVINKILKAFRIPGIELTVDKQKYFVSINYTTNHPSFGVLTYKDMNNDLGTSIPFLLSRLEA